MEHRTLQGRAECFADPFSPGTQQLLPCPPVNLAKLPVSLSCRMSGPVQHRSHYSLSHPRPVARDQGTLFAAYQIFARTLT